MSISLQFKVSTAIAIGYSIAYFGFASEAVVTAERQIIYSLSCFVLISAIRVPVNSVGIASPALM